MSKLIVGRSRVLALVVAAALLAVFAWVAVAGGPAEPAASDQAAIEVSSSAEVIIVEGQLLRPAY